jgi:hypothetical protein
MVPDIIRPHVMEPTGARRVRISCGLFGTRPIVEVERFVEFRSVPIGAPIRIERQWFRVSARNYVGIVFYNRRGAG